jgi:hypothetical protein
MKLILALPGNIFKTNIVIQTIQFIDYCSHHDIEVILSIEGGSNVSIVREKCMGISQQDVVDGSQVVPFYGKIDYDYILWVDSDMTFKINDFEQLLSRNVDIVSAACKKSPKEYACAKMPKDFKQVDVLQCITDDDLNGQTELIEAISFGFAFVLIKRGVFEKVPRPWFCTQMYKIGDKSLFVGEDVYFCLKARDAGFKLWIDPLTNVQHIKDCSLVRSY